MAWDTTWDADTIYVAGYDHVNSVELPSVKDLLADVCNAINERRKYYLDSKIAWKIADGTTATDVTPDDFVGLRLNSSDNTRTYHILGDVLQQIVDGIESLFYNDEQTEIGPGIIVGLSLRDTGYFTDNTFTTRWELLTIIDDVGLYTYDDLIHLENWRYKRWWETIRGILERLRYLEIQSGIETGEGNIEWTGEDTQTYYGDGDITRSETWTLSRTSGDTDFDDDLAAVKIVGWRALVQYFWPYRDLVAVDPFESLGIRFSGYFVKSTDVSLAWDSDYKPNAAAIRDSFGSIRTYPIPKTCYLESIAGIARGRYVTASGSTLEFDPDFVPIGWLRLICESGGGIDYETPDPGSPDHEDVILELAISGETFSVDATNAALVWVELNIGADGDDFFTMENTDAPTIVPTTALAFDPPDNIADGILTSVGGSVGASQHFARLEQISVRFDLQTELDYPAI